MKVKPRLAWFSLTYADNDSSESPSAYFSGMVLPFLRERFDIEIFHNSFASYEDYPAFHYLTAFKRHEDNPFDFFFYQLEDSRACGFVRMHLALMPGVVLFHNFLFSDDGPEPILNSPWSDVLNTFLGRNESWPEREKEHKKESKFALREGAMAIVPVFTREKDRGDFTRLAKQTICCGQDPLSFFLPYPSSLPSFPLKPAKPDRILFCGAPRIENRIHMLLAALSSMERKPALKWLIADSERKQAENLMTEFGIEDFELLAERTPAAWQRLVEQGGIAAHVHFSVFGQTGPYLEISLAHGLPVLVTDFGAADYLPSSAVFKIPAGEQEAAAIKEVLERIQRDASLWSVAQAASFGREFFSSEAVAGELAYIFERSALLVNEMCSKWSVFEGRSQEALLREIAGNKMGQAIGFFESGGVRSRLRDAYAELWGVTL